MQVPSRRPRPEPPVQVPSRRPRPASAVQARVGGAGPRRRPPRAVAAGPRRRPATRRRDRAGHPVPPTPLSPLRRHVDGRRAGPAGAVGAEVGARRRPGALPPTAVGARGGQHARRSPPAAACARTVCRSDVSGSPARRLGAGCGHPPIQGRSPRRRPDLRDRGRSPRRRPDLRNRGRSPPPSVPSASGASGARRRGRWRDARRSSTSRSPRQVAEPRRSRLRGRPPRRTGWMSSRSGGALGCCRRAGVGRQRAGPGEGVVVGPAAGGRRRCGHGGAGAGRR